MMKEWMSLRAYPWTKIILVAVAYFLAAKIGLLQAIPPGYATAIWPASGIALAAVLLLDYQIWPGIWLGSFLGNVLTLHSGMNIVPIFLSAAFIGIGATVQAIVGAYLLRKLSNKTNFFENIYAAFVFIIFSAAIACLINSLVGPTSLLLLGTISKPAYFNTWLTWWLGDLTGVITVTPIIMAWQNNMQINFRLKKFLEAILFLILMTINSYLVFFANFPLRFVLPLFAVWASFTLGTRFATISGLYLSVIIIYSISHGYSGFQKTFYGSLLLAQIFIAIIFIIVILISAALNERKMAYKKINEMNKNLQIIVTERTKQLEQSLSLAKATLESTADGILVVDLHEKVIDYNHQFAEMWNIPKSILDSKNDAKFLEYVKSQLQNPDDFFAKVKSLYKTPESINLDEIKFSDGRIFERYSRPQKIGTKTVGRVWSFRNITQRKAMEYQLINQTTHDSLTNLPNRLLLVDRIHQAILSAKRNQKYAAILFFDLDRFKLINDKLGHSIGDSVLLLIADRLKESLRKSDTIARIGGDEFVIVLPNLNKKEDIEILIKKILRVFEIPMYFLDQELHLTTSIGISFYPTDGTDPETLLKNADDALYKAKESGRNNYQFFTPDIEGKNPRNVILESSLYRAYLNKEFLLFYQPIINLKTGKISSAEALLYWQHPSLGLIRPLKFIKSVEVSKLIIPIGEWVLYTACKQVKTWQKEGFPKTRIAVNISGQQFSHQNFLSIIDNVLNKTHFPPQDLELELAESTLLISNEKILLTMQDLKKKGINLILDDFGTGHSGLNYLKKFPIDKIKIDKTFIHGIESNPNNIAIIKAFMDIAKSLNLKVVAEGIETIEQLKFMQTIGCEEAQGYFFAHPLPAEQFERLLREDRTFLI